jgi:hypothetical protein
MAHPHNRNDTPELRLQCLTEFPPRQGTYPIDPIDAMQLVSSAMLSYPNCA